MRLPNRICSVLVLMWLATSCATAPRPQPASWPPVPVQAAIPEQPTPPQPARNLYLWRVSHPSRPAGAWLLGSVHVGRSTAPLFDGAIVDAFQRSSRLAVEVDLTKVSGKEMFAAISEHG